MRIKCNKTHKDKRKNDKKYKKIDDKMYICIYYTIKNKEKWRGQQ